MSLRCITIFEKSNTTSSVNLKCICFFVFLSPLDFGLYFIIKMYMYVCICICICMYIYIYIYIYILILVLLFYNCSYNLICNLA